MVGSTIRVNDKASLNILASLQRRLTLLLGPPACGKTTFLRALAGKLPPSKLKGTVTYNGHRCSEFCAPRTAAFVPQSDVHIATMTALETTSFSYDMQHGPHGALVYTSAIVWTRQCAGGRCTPSRAQTLACMRSKCLLLWPCADA